MIVLGGCAAVEKAAADAGVAVTVPVHPRSYRRDAGDDRRRRHEVARAARRRLPQLGEAERQAVAGDAAGRPGLHARADRQGDDVLVGGLRVLGANTGGTQHGVFTERPGVLSQDFFRTLLDLDVQWSTSADQQDVYEARDAAGQVVRSATAVDLVFGSNAILRGIAEVYSFDESKEKFVRDFVDAWDKVMMLDRYDVR
jgi:catalase-peroxidase